jgi:hypothetical protein
MENGPIVVAATTNNDIARVVIMPTRMDFLILSSNNSDKY